MHYLDQQYIQRQVKTLEILGVPNHQNRAHKRLTYSIKPTIIEELSKQQLLRASNVSILYTNVSCTSALYQYPT